MKFIDISRPLLKAPKYPTAPDTVLDQVDRIVEGKDSNFTHITTNTHAGTHADAFCHFVDGGTAIGDMPLELYYGPCRVLSFPERTILTREDFQGKLTGAERVAIHGGGFTYLRADAAQYLADCGIRCLVTDGWSPAPLDNEKEIHRILLLNHVAVIENVILDHVKDGDYDLIAFPANFGDTDGAPVRAVLVEQEETI